jgi:SAM-dependent methyltransferase
MSMTDPEHKNDHTEKLLDRYVAECGEYTSDYERSKLTADWQAKEIRAQGVVEDFRRRATDPAEKLILDIGFGNGEYVIALTRSGARVSGLEVNEILAGIAKENLSDKRMSADLRLYDGKKFPFPDASFDCAFSVSVLEHCSYPESVIAEIGRVLKPGGCCYLAFPNRFAPKETHSGFWLISYLPRTVARWILRLGNRNTIDELNLHFLSYFNLRSFLKQTDLRIRFETHTGGRGPRLIKRLLATFGIHHSILLPHIMVILDKGKEPSA